MAFPIWAHMEHNGRGRRGGRCTEAENRSPSDSPQAGEGCGRPRGQRMAGIKPNLCSSQGPLSFWLYGVNNIYFVGGSKD